MIPIDKDSQSLIPPHFINFAPQGVLVALAAAMPPCCSSNHEI